MRFYDSALWKDYNENRARALITAARSALTIEDRVQKAVAVGACADGLVSQAVKDECEIIEHLFTNVLPLSEKVAYVLEKDSEARLAAALSFEKIENAEDAPFDWKWMEPVVPYNDLAGR